MSTTKHVANLKGVIAQVVFLGCTLWAVPSYAQDGKPAPPIDAKDATDYFQKVLPSIYYDDNRYDGDKAFILLDPKGNPVGRKPVGIDEDDVIVVIIAFPMLPSSGTHHNYTIAVTGDDYNPVDLRITGSVPATKEDAKLLAEKNGEPKWTHVRFDFGPYTSAQVSLTIQDNDKALATHTFRINDLYHVFVGASFISSQLEDPTFTVVPLDTATNTIQAINGGARTIATANVTWYWWPTLRRWFKGDNVTRGRDILKEPNFLERINPTFGVAISEKVFENFFVGGSFEFARGGALTLGGHYGPTTRLVDRSFVLGETAYSGQDSDIRTERVNDWGFFFGITLDTRLIGALRQR